MDTDNKSLKSLASSYSPTHSEDTNIQPSNNTHCADSEGKPHENNTDEALQATHLQQGDHHENNTDEACEVTTHLQQGGDQLSVHSCSPASKVYCGSPGCTKCCSALAFVWGILTSHLGLFIILLLYTLGGAYMMLEIEGTEQKPFVPGIMNRTGVVPAENFTQWFVARTIRKRMDLWGENDRDTFLVDTDHDNDTSDEIEALIRASLNSTVQLMMNATELRMLLNSYFNERKMNARKDDIQDRTFWEWMLFCLTIYTTIGYGSVFPVTNSGRVATMIYATIGVPLFLVTMAKMGKLLTRAVKLVWSYIRKCFYLKHVRRVRKQLSVKRRNLSVKRKNFSVKRLQGKNKTHNNTPSTNTTTKPCDSGSDDDDIMEKGEGVLKHHWTMNATDQAPEKAEDAISYVSYKVDDEFNLNPLVAILITIVYIFLGSWMYSTWEEDWSFYDAFYFIFISVTTIGLGDLVPKHPIFFLLSSIYVLIGLSLVAMVIHVLTEFFTSTIHIVENRIHIRRGYKDATIPTLLNQAQIRQIADSIPQIRIHVQDSLSVLRNEADSVSMIHAQENLSAVKNEADDVGLTLETVEPDNHQCLTDVNQETDNGQCVKDVNVETDNGQCVRGVNQETDNRQCLPDVNVETDNGQCLPDVNVETADGQCVKDVKVETDNGQC